MKTLDRNTVLALNADISAALAAIEKKHGVQLTLGKTKYDATSADHRSAD